jgi:hypothetical protein
VIPRPNEDDFCVRLSPDQEEVAPNVALKVFLVLPPQRMNLVLSAKRLPGNQVLNDRQ